MSGRLRVGLSGCGSVSQRGLIPHLAQPDVQDRIEFRAVMDPVEGRAKAVSELREIPLWYQDYDQMLEEGDLDMMVIASPIGFHYERGLKAVQMGMHVHFNKTMTTTKREADEIIEAARVKGSNLWPPPERCRELPTRKPGGCSWRNASSARYTMLCLEEGCSTSTRRSARATTSCRM